MKFTEKIPKLNSIIKDSDYTDMKAFEGQVTMREFITSMLSYYPWWVVLLYRIRAIVVSIPGLEKQEKPDKPFHMNPDELSFIPGQEATFFIVRHGEENLYWIAETPPDKHLTAYLAVVSEPLPNKVNRFHVITIVKYKHWTGPVYFNLIRPFHHLLLVRMGNAGLMRQN